MTTGQKIATIALVALWGVGYWCFGTLNPLIWIASTAGFFTGIIDRNVGPASATGFLVSFCVVVVLGAWGVFYFFRPKGQAAREQPAAKLYEQAAKLERRGQIDEALAAYDDIAARFADTEVANDAGISAEELRKR